MYPSVPSYPSAPKPPAYNPAYPVNYAHPQAHPAMNPSPNVSFSHPSRPVEEYFDIPTPFKAATNSFGTVKSVRVVAHVVKEKNQSMLSFTDSTKFDINFNANQDNRPETYFHFNPRFSESQIVCGSTKHGAWQPEERSRSFPFSFDKIFTLDFIPSPTEMEVKYNGRHLLSFKFRDTMQYINEIAISGNIKVHYVGVL
ncbi:hypothetical protein L596_021062 [Steinernema carpocapsae]|uniref:Galectin n=1 Tax=Steinernema carpocapsae TaxID=34508 RepID=A0A4U5MW14_STECR|nr:hypothetical protein L596_021062 [Steinernema carpocapsae]